MIRPGKIFRLVLGRRGSLLLLILMLLPPLVPIARADGGIVMCQRTSAVFKITLFSTEMPLQPGPADFSVLLERTGGYSPILDAQVFIELEHESGTRIYAEATRRQARNKLVYCSLITLPKSGDWKMMLHVISGDEKVDMLYDLVVAAPPPVLLSNWGLISLPPVLIILFIINQWLRRIRY